MKALGSKIQRNYDSHEETDDWTVIIAFVRETQLLRSYCGKEIKINCLLAPEINEGVAGLADTACPLVNLTILNLNHNIIYAEGVF